MGFICKNKTTSLCLLEQNHADKKRTYSTCLSRINFIYTFFRTNHTAKEIQKHIPLFTVQYSWAFTLIISKYKHFNWAQLINTLMRHELLFKPTVLFETVSNTSRTTFTTISVFTRTGVLHYKHKIGTKHPRM